MAVSDSDFAILLARVQRLEAGATARPRQGIPGPVGNQAWKGAWSGATNYVFGDAVSHGGASYIANAESLNQAPPNASYWDVQAEPGEDGTDGATWRSGSGAPSNGTGQDGDLYLRTSNQDLYQRSGGTYSVITNLKGAAGVDGTGVTVLTGSPTGKIFAVSLTDGGTYDLPAVTNTAVVLLSAGATYGLWTVNGSGGTGVTGPGTAANADTGSSLCLFINGGVPRIKNNLGGTRVVTGLIVAS